MRPACINAIFELAKRDERIVYIGSDLDPALAQRMRDELPGRAHMCGVSEQHLIGMAAGLATQGFIPFVHTIAAFITRRCYEQIALDVCLPNLPVRLVGNGGGLIYAPLGPTHLATDDFALMRALPNMTIVAPAGAHEMSDKILASSSIPGPIYFRVAFDTKELPAAPALARYGRNILLCSTGVMSDETLRAAHELDASMMHCASVKPLPQIFDAAPSCREYKMVVTVEEHSTIGGLGSAITDQLIAAGYRGRIKRLGIPDTFLGQYGTREDLLAVCGLLPEQIIARVQEWRGNEIPAKQR